MPNVLPTGITGYYDPSQRRRRVESAPRGMSEWERAQIELQRELARERANLAAMESARRQSAQEFATRGQIVSSIIGRGGATESQIERLLAGRGGPGAAPPPRLSPDQEYAQKMGVRVGTPYEIEDRRRIRQAQEAQSRLSAEEYARSTRRATPSVMVDGMALPTRGAFTREQAAKMRDIREAFERGVNRPEPAGPLRVRGSEYVPGRPAVPAVGSTEGYAGPRPPSRLAPEDQALVTEVSTAYGQQSPYGQPAQAPAVAAAPAPAPGLTEAQRADIAELLSRRGVVPPMVEATQETLQRPDIQEAMRVVGQRPAGLPPPAPGSPEAQQEAAARAMLEQNRYSSDLRSPSVVGIGGRPVSIPSPYAGMERQPAMQADTERQARIYAGQLEQMGQTPEEVTAALAERFPGFAGQYRQLSQPMPGIEARRSAIAAALAPRITPEAEGEPVLGREPMTPLQQEQIRLRGREVDILETESRERITGAKAATAQPAAEAGAKVPRLSDSFFTAGQYSNLQEILTKTDAALATATTPAARAQVAADIAAKLGGTASLRQKAEKVRKSPLWLHVAKRAAMPAWLSLATGEATAPPQATPEGVANLYEQVADALERAMQAAPPQKVQP